MKKLIILTVLVCVSFFVSAQSADFLTEMLETDAVTFGHASYLCMVHTEPENDGLTYAAANARAVLMGIASADVSYDEKIPLGKLCAMLAKVFGVKGGALYRASKGMPRYAFRQFQVDGIVSRDADSSQKVSGEEFLNMYTRCIRVYGE